MASFMLRQLIVFAVSVAIAISCPQYLSSCVEAYPSKTAEYMKRKKITQSKFGLIKGIPFKELY